MELRDHLSGIVESVRAPVRTGAAPRLRERRLFGNLLQFRTNAFRLLERASAIGDVTRVDLFWRAVYFVKHPDALAPMFDSQEVWQRTEGLVPLLGRNILTSNGADWAASRQFASPSFHPGMTARGAAAFAASVEPLLDEWKRFAGGEMDLARETVRLFAQCATRVLGVELTPDEASRFPEAILRLQRWGFKVVAGGARISAQARADRAFLEAILDRAMNAIPREGEPPTYAERMRQDLSVDRRAVRDNLRLAMIAASDNPPNSIAFTLWLLSRNPHVEDALRADIGRVLGREKPTVEALDAIPRLDRVVQESMRLLPPVWMLARKSSRDTELLGHPVRKGTYAFACPYFVHRHPAFWPEPDRFDPDRFLPENVERRHRLAYLPFGSGPRMCIGARLATLEIRLFLVLFLQRFRAHAAATELPLEGLFALRSLSGVRARLDAAA